MAPNRGVVINIGEAVRAGLRLRAREAVALVYEACALVDAGVAVSLPTSLDGLSLTTKGVNIVGRNLHTQDLQTAVAGLLEALLGAVTDEIHSVPPALRSLPARLREASTETPPVVRDLLAILRWHLRQDPRQVLLELMARTSTTSGGAPDDLPLQHKPVVEQASGPDVAPSTGGPSTPAPRSRNKVVWAFLTVLIAFAVSGYAGYRYLSWPLPVDPPPPAVEPPSPSVEKAPTIGEPTINPASARDEPRPLPLPVRGGAFSPSFTAQPQTLLFHAGHNTAGHLYTATLDDRGLPSRLTRLLDEPARNYHARLSPDGKWIAFDSDRGGERGVYLADTTGTSISRVSGEGFGAVPSWSPDMKSLAFIRAEPGQPRVWNLWIRTLATGALSRVTQYRSGQVWGASWFPDSASYAYSHEEELIIADSSGRRLASYQSPVPGRMVRTPAVSPDGRQIVFQVFRDGVWVLDLASGTMHGLLDDPSAEEFAWDPSGRRIAYHSRRDGEWRIWMLSL